VATLGHVRGGTEIEKEERQLVVSTYFEILVGPSGARRFWRDSSAGWRDTATI
jgi:hypothetical protein